MLDRQGPVDPLGPIRGVQKVEQIVLDRPDDVEMFAQTDGVDTAAQVDRLLRVKAQSGVALVHEEHQAIILPPGDFIVRNQREYSPESLRFVAD